METNKYSLGKIYTIRHPDTDKFYIGSTCEKYLSNRFAKHKSQYKGILPKTRAVLLFDLGVDDCYIELLETYPCNNKAELEKREGELMRLHKDNIVNRKIEGRTKKEYRTDNKEIIKEHRKEYYETNKEQIDNQHKQYYEVTKDNKHQYYEANKEHILNRQKQLYTCVCGATIQHTEKPRHNKSKKHLKFMEI
jgi:hypothetical protein